MADFIKRKLQVFVSSTYTDLRDERQAAVEAILAAGHIPAGMELFAAGDESQMEVIKQWIDESDVYFLILGARYGTIDKATGKSYTHLEYEYALSKSKPLFACVMNDSITEERVKTLGLSVLERENPQLLKAFRELVLSKTSKFWQDTKDIKITIIDRLAQLSRREDLEGWVRSSNQSNLPFLADEIARLSKENSLLRSQLSETAREESINGLTFIQLRDLLKERGVLDFFTAGAAALAGPRGMRLGDAQQRASAHELSMRGLVRYDPGVGVYTITESGRIFMNKHEASMLAEKKG